MSRHQALDHAYLREVAATDLLSAEEERALALGIAGGDAEARDHLVRANLRLVVRLARQARGRGLPFEDLVAEGNLGLIRAAEGFDPAVGVRFATYAKHWIGQSIRAALIRHGRPVRLPHHAVTLVARWRRAAAALRGRLGREPEPREVGVALGLSERKLRLAIEALRASELEACPEDEGESALDRLAGGSPDAGLEEEESLGRLRAALGRLEEREARVVRLRYGLEAGSGPLTLSEVGKRVGLSRQGANVAERRALGRLASALGTV
jgi:RNA polymerase primary sigma factor